MNQLLWLKEIILHEVRQHRGRLEEVRWWTLLIQVYDAVAERHGVERDHVEAVAARLRSAAAVPETVEAAEWRATAERWLWTFLSSFKFEEMEFQFVHWRTLPPERIRRLGLLRNVLASVRQHPEFLATFSTPDQEQLSRWLALPPMR